MLASRIATQAPCHMLHFGFCKGVGTAEAQCNFLTAVQARLAGFSDACDLSRHPQDFRHSQPDVLMVKLHDNGITGELWNAVRLLYEDTRRRVTCGHGVSDSVDGLQIVARGCPLALVLFSIYTSTACFCNLHDAAAKHDIRLPCNIDAHSRPRSTVGCP